MGNDEYVEVYYAGIKTIYGSNMQHRWVMKRVWDDYKSMGQAAYFNKMTVPMSSVNSDGYYVGPRVNTDDLKL